MKIFARDHVFAKSRFWYFVSQLRKLKKAHGQVISVKKLKERNTLSSIKNFGIFFRYNARTGTHNMYKEFRDVSRVGAVEQMCMCSCCVVVFVLSLFFSIFLSFVSAI
jgi:large subunit ribosomal protein L18Ae